MHRLKKYSTFESSKIYNLPILLVNRNQGFLLCERFLVGVPIDFAQRPAIWAALCLEFGVFVGVALEQFLRAAAAFEVKFGFVSHQLSPSLGFRNTRNYHPCTQSKTQYPRP